MELLARETLAEGSVDMISKIFDQNLEFVSLEHRLFSLDRPGSYVQYNDPTCPDAQVYNRPAILVRERRAGAASFFNALRPARTSYFIVASSVAALSGARLNAGRRP